MRLQSPPIYKTYTKTGWFWLVHSTKRWQPRGARVSRGQLTPIYVTLALAAIFSNYCASNLHINAHTKTKQAWSTTLSPVSEAFFTSPFIAQTGTTRSHRGPTELGKHPRSRVSGRTSDAPMADDEYHQDQALPRFAASFLSTAQTRRNCCLVSH